MMGMGDELHYHNRQKRSNLVLWGIFALLLILTAGVFFILPNFVQAPDPETVRIAVSSNIPVSNAPAEQGLSPFEEAQRMRQREAAQNTLSELLALQENLEKKQVLSWAGSEFESALALARDGDVAYREQRFIEADETYRQGYEILQAISDSETLNYERLMNQGLAALMAGNADQADDAYSLALMINPDSSDAVTGMERARVLDDLLALLENGSDLQADNQLEAAREQYRQARALDPDHPEAAAAVEQINVAILERDFASAMSRGYASLQNGDPDAARRAFEQAEALKPGSEQVATAKQQAEDQKTFAALNVHLDAAKASEAREDWAAALAAWNEALLVDPNLVPALEGKRRSESRNNLDIFLRAIEDEPLRVAEEELWNQASQVVADARRIPDPGPRLLGQLQNVQNSLQRALVPVEVQLQSDGITDVTIYRVGPLGQFNRQTLSLTPGNYVAVGVRPGYRDVREEFVVTIDGQAPVVTIACNDPV